MNDDTPSNAVASNPALPSVPTEIPPFDRRDRPWVTSGRVWVGGAHQAARPQTSDDAALIQRALLRFPTTRDGQIVSVIETDTSLRARAARALRSFTSRLRGF